MGQGILKEKIKIYIKVNKMKIQYQYLQNTVKAVMKGKFIEVNAYTGQQQKKPPINNISSHFKN